MDALAGDIGSGGSLRSIGRVRRFWWVVVAGALVGLVAGAAGMTMVAKQYSALTAIVIYPPPDQTSVSGARTNATVNMDNELQFITSVSVASAAKASLHVKTALAVLQAQVTATVPPNTSVIDVTCAASTPLKAQDCSSAFAQAYLDVRKAQADALVSGQKTALGNQLTDLQNQLAKWDGVVGSTVTATPQHAAAVAQQTISLNAINNINARLSPLSTLDTTAGAIIAQPVRPTSASKPIPALYVGSGVFLGLVLGLLLAVLAARRDRRVRTADDVELRVGRAVIASIPKPGRGKVQGGVLSARTGAGEFDRLRLRLDSATPDRAGSVVIVAPEPGHGASFVAGNLSLSMARAGAEVVLVVADPESTTATLFGLQESPGLANALQEDRSLDDIAQEVSGRPRLRVVVPGRDLADVFDRVPVQRVAVLVDRLVQTGHRVILEAPPVERGTEAQELARWAGSALVVVELDSTTIPAVQHSFDELEQSGALVPGAVLVPEVPAPVRPVGRDANDRATAEAVTPSRP